MNDTNNKEVILTPEGNQVSVNNMQEDPFTHPMTKDEILDTLETSRKQKEADEIKYYDSQTSKQRFNKSAYY